MQLENKLKNSSSPYLKEAADQPVHWQEYSDDVLKLASELDRPILLDIGAVWCHWCHVMDHESYSDPQLAELINRLFVPVKVDRDQMPDLDSRYQTAIGALTGTGGWPLTAFLTPDGSVFYGGTYFPRTDTQGRPGLLSLLPQIAEVFSKRRDDITKSAQEVYDQLKEYEVRSSVAGELSENIVKSIISDAKSRYDDKFGGFGTAPKFFNATTLQLLSEVAVAEGDQELDAIVKNTLENISRGGVYDQIGGGFHRYSVDRYWHVPHFEKMLYDNALMLKLYLRPLLTGNSMDRRRIARETADWISKSMASAAGPFYAHQDADIGADDDGSYWTWTREEFQRSLTPEEFRVMEQHFDVRKEPADIAGAPSRNVLRIALSVEDIAGLIGKSAKDVGDMVEQGRRKLIEERSRRMSPLIDTSIFADRNGLAISALVEASLELKTKSYLDAASRSADFILANMTSRKGKVAHAYSEGKVTYDGLLDDEIMFGTALLDLFDVMRSDNYIDSAQRIAEVLLDEFEDKQLGGFFDRPVGGDAGGLLANRKKPIEDIPTPSGNSAAAMLFDRLFTITDNRKYYEVAEKTLKAFAGSAPKLGIFAANYARALLLHLRLQKAVR